MSTRIRATAELFSEHGIHLFFLHRGHFLDPRVPPEWETLRRQPDLLSDEVCRLVCDELPARIDQLAAGIYFPLPILRARHAGGSLEEALARFHYQLVRVDEDQVWWWRGERVAPRTRDFFWQHLSYHPIPGIYFFEYRVNPEWWDKSYLDAAVTPMQVRQFEIGTSGELRVRLHHGGWETVVGQRLRLDARERLFCTTRGSGEAMFSEQSRFALLEGISEDCTTVRLGELTFSLVESPDPFPTTVEGRAG